jgi:hypothetical protein
MKALICGGRENNKETDEKRLFAYMDQFVSDEAANGHATVCIVHGGARGTDTSAERWAKVRGISSQVVRIKRSDWKKYGLGAGPMRNAKMLALKPDVVIAFPGGNGTKDMIKQARAANVRVIEVQQEGQQT